MSSLLQIYSRNASETMTLLEFGLSSTHINLERGNHWGPAGGSENGRCDRVRVDNFLANRVNVGDNKREDSQLPENEDFWRLRGIPRFRQTPPKRGVLPFQFY